MAHRIVWALVFLAGIMIYRRQRGLLRSTIKSWNDVLPHIGTACLLGVNWFTYIWAVSNDQVIETSLGYFINPLINVLLGVVFLRESVRPGQVMAIVVAAMGVSWLTISYGSLPWIALTLAFTFGVYGLVRKTAALDALGGLTVEMGILFVPALALLIYLEVTGSAIFAHASGMTSSLLALAGVVTALPLLLFAAGARRIRLITLGILQYVAPTLQFLLGVFLFDEPFTEELLLGFSLIWLALLVYSVEGAREARRQTRIGLNQAGAD
jgi:chloramphenicol-sensitive protein RarD